MWFAIVAPTAVASGAGTGGACGPGVYRHRRWLENKTPAVFETWLAREANAVLVAVGGDSILSVGGVTATGLITLNYVSPDSRFQGVSKTMLRALESRAAARGNTHCTLISTETARCFYLAQGYEQTGMQLHETRAGSGWPLAKAL